MCTEYLANYCCMHRNRCSPLHPDIDSNPQDMGRRQDQKYHPQRTRCQPLQLDHPTTVSGYTDKAQTSTGEQTRAELRLPIVISVFLYSWQCLCHSGHSCTISFVLLNEVSLL